MYEDSLQHYGVKGMKWGVRHDDRPSVSSTRQRKVTTNTEKKTVEARKKREASTRAYNRAYEEYCSNARKRGEQPNLVNASNGSSITIHPNGFQIGNSKGNKDAPIISVQNMQLASRAGVYGRTAYDRGWQDTNIQYVDGVDLDEALKQKEELDTKVRAYLGDKAVNDMTQRNSSTPTKMAYELPTSKKVQAVIKNAKASVSSLFKKKASVKKTTPKKNTTKGKESSRATRLKSKK